MKINKSLKFKTINDEEHLEKLVADGTSNRLHLAECKPLTIEPFVSMMRTDSYTSFMTNH